MKEKYQLKRLIKIMHTKIISNNVGKTLKVTKRRVNSIPPIPRSIILLNAPVCLLRWNFKDKL